MSYGIPTVFKKSELNLDYGFYYSRQAGIGPVSIRIEIGVRDDMGLVMFAESARKKWTGYFEDSPNGFDGTLYARGHSYGGLALYHFNKHIPLHKFDAYAGVGAGIFTDLWEAKNTHNIPIYRERKTRAVLLALTGIRYYPAKNVGFFIEAGRLGHSSFNLGTSLSF